MGFDFGQLHQMGGQIDQVLSSLSYPIEKDELLQRVHMAGANQQIVGAMDSVLPDKTYNSPQDIKNIINRSSQGKM